MLNEESIILSEKTLDDEEFNIGGGGIEYVDDWWGSRIKLELSTLAYSKMVHYTQRADGEISGFGKIDKIGNRIIVTNVKIFKQKCTSVHTELDEEALSMFLVDLIRKGENPAKWKLWWHSHNDFAVGWSETDEDNIKKHSKSSYLLSLCINKNVDMTGRIDDKRQHSVIPVKVLPIRGRLISRCHKEVKKKVTYGRNTVEYINVAKKFNNKEEQCDIQDSQDLFRPSFWLNQKLV